MAALAKRVRNKIYKTFPVTAPHQPAPIIVYGPPRSGTTYLGEILSRHPEVMISNEYRVFTWLHEAAKVLPEIDDKVLHGRAEFKQHLDKNLPKIIRSFYINNHPDTRYWGDKNPYYGGDIRRLEAIDEYFPGTKFINIVRDGRDVVVSLMKKTWPDGRPWADFDTAHQVWNSNIDTSLGFAKKTSPNRHYFIKYEDLVGNDTDEAKKIFEFLGITWHDDVEEFTQKQRKKRTVLSSPVRDLKKPGNIGESLWLDYFDNKKQSQSYKLLQKNLKKMGYI